MREIKFRAWDKEKKKWARVENGCSTFAIEPADGVPWYLECGEMMAPCPELIVNQFTGLHDKNGKEIYEGDILKHRVGDKLIGKGQVIFGLHSVGPDSWGLEMKSLGFALQWEDESGYAELEYGDDNEVVGNVYENPELLELGSAHDKVE